MGSLFFIILYLAVMSLSSLPLWREERLLFIRWATGPPLLASSLHDIFPGLLAGVFWALQPSARHCWRSEHGKGIHLQVGTTSVKRSERSLMTYGISAVNMMRCHG